MKRFQQLHEQFAAEWSERDFSATLSTATDELAVARELMGEKHPAVVRALLDIGLASHANGLDEKSKQAEQEALALLHQLQQQADTSPDDPHTADFLIFEADRLWNLYGDTPDVMEKFSRAAALREKYLGVAHADTAEALARWAEVENLRAHFSDAEPLYRRALIAYEKANELDDPYVEKSLQGLGQTLMHLERPEDAWPFIERALAWAEQFGVEKRALYYLLISAVQCRRALGDSTGAVVFETRALSLLPKANPGAEGFHV